MFSYLYMPNKIFYQETPVHTPEVRINSYRIHICDITM
uniref:Uncharacterized protein n=1 Tax=Arundo donax TaxID=35708 RepID=A0A0A8YPQ3_ARUDO